MASAKSGATESDWIFASRLSGARGIVLVITSSSRSDAEMRLIAVHKLEGRTNEEIADLVGRSLATVVRRLGLIREYWEKELPG